MKLLKDTLEYNSEKIIELACEKLCEISFQFYSLFEFILTYWGGVR